MYSSDLKTSDRSGAIAAALAIQAALVVAFLNIAGKMESSETQVPLHFVRVSMPVLTPPQPKRQISKPRRNDAGTTQKNIKSERMALVTPRPVIALPHVREDAMPTTPREGKNLIEGQSAVRGVGTSSGDGGSGIGEGNGAGSGDGGGVMEPPHLATAVLSSYDFPREIIAKWPRGSTIFLRLKIDAGGYVSECLVDRGSNVPVIDSQMCNEAHERLRFRPALNRRGQAVAGWFGYAQPAPR